MCSVRLLLPSLISCQILFFVAKVQLVWMMSAVHSNSSRLVRTQKIVIGRDSARVFYFEPSTAVLTILLRSSKWYPTKHGKSRETFPQVYHDGKTPPDLLLALKLRRRIATL